MIQAAVSVAVLVAHVAACFTVLLTQRRHPSATLAWLLVLAFLPVVGLVSWLVIGRTRATRLAQEDRKIAARIEEVWKTCDVRSKLDDAAGGDLEPRTHSLLRLGRGLTGTPPSAGNRVEMLVDAGATYSAMLEALATATEHVHVEFYIIQPDTLGRQMRDHLVARARAGIEVRVLCDAVGSAALPDRFWDPLRDAGGEAAFFRPLGRIFTRFRRRDRIDFRNHRKIVIVDGRVGFTGGINVGREYLGLDPERGRWRDTHVQIEGPAALVLQSTFAGDWFATTGHLLDDARYFPDPVSPASADHDCIVQIIESGPDRSWSPIEHIYTHATALARDRLWITNPYFVPSPPVEQALQSAALRGVDVRLLVPARGDSRIVTWAAGSYFEPLLEAGGRIYRYERGFVHAKTMVVDDWAATIGSANMDMRSFQLNYELNAFILGGGFANRVAAQFLADLEGAEEADLQSEQDVGLGRRVLRAGARLMSPLL